MLGAMPPCRFFAAVMHFHADASYFYCHAILLYWRADIMLLI